MSQRRSRRTSRRSQQGLSPLLAFVLCDTVIEDVETGKKTLVGIFDLVISSQVPAYVPNLAAYVCLAGYAQPGTRSVRVRCYDPEGRVLVEGNETVRLSDEESVAEIVFAFEGFCFREPGRYRFTCEVDGQLMAERFIHLRVPAD